MTPNFDSMSKEELKAYVLSHKGDREAFYKLADRLKQDNQNSPWYPYPKTPEDIIIMENTIQARVKPDQSK